MKCTSSLVPTSTEWMIATDGTSRRFPEVWNHCSQVPIVRCVWRLFAPVLVLFLQLCSIQCKRCNDVEDRYLPLWVPPTRDEKRSAFFCVDVYLPICVRSRSFFLFVFFFFLLFYFFFFFIFFFATVWCGAKSFSCTCSYYYFPCFFCRLMLLVLHLYLFLVVILILDICLQSGMVLFSPVRRATRQPVRRCSQAFSRELPRRATRQECSACSAMLYCVVRRVARRGKKVGTAATKGFGVGCHFARRDQNAVVAL